MAKAILVIDDEALITRSLFRLLTKQGYSVAVAQSGAEALEKITTGEFNLIISDVRMPGQDGIETIKQIRQYLKESNKKPIPEIFITGYADAEKYEEAKDLKVLDYIYKPFDNVEVLRVIKKAIG